jgi:uncharacterized protein (DUF2062 family)
MMNALWQNFKNILARELRANTSPLRASLSLALGILVGFSPFYGLHIVTLIPLTVLFKLNRPLALLAVSTTSLPVVPFWVAAGIFTGKLFIPLIWCERLVERVGSLLPEGGVIVSIVAFFRKFFPEALFARLPVDGHHLAAGFLQWAMGSCVLAVFSAIVTVTITYPLFSRMAAKRKKLESVR